MTTETALQQAADLLAPYARITTTPESNRLDVQISRLNLLAAVQALLNAHWGYLSAITGLDHPGTTLQSSEEKQWDRLGSTTSQQDSIFQEGYMEALYHFCSGAAVVTLRAHLPYKNLTVPSICGLIPSATLYERELIEMFGMTVEGTPDTSRLILPEDWPDGVYPLRKEFPGLDTAGEA